MLYKLEKLQNSRKRASFWLTAYKGRAFVCAAAPWNSLPESLKDTALVLRHYRNHLRTFLFFRY